MYMYLVSIWGVGQAKASTYNKVHQIISYVDLSLGIVVLNRLGKAIPIEKVFLPAAHEGKVGWSEMIIFAVR